MEDADFIGAFCSGKGFVIVDEGTEGGDAVIEVFGIKFLCGGRRGNREFWGRNRGNKG